MQQQLETMTDDEVTALAVKGALDEAIETMGAVGLGASAIVGELLGRCVLGLWCDGEDRAALRDKACAAITAHVHGLFDSIGDDAPSQLLPCVTAPTTGTVN